MFKVTASARNCVQPSLAVAGFRQSGTSSLPPFKAGPSGPGSSRSYGTLLANRSGQGLPGGTGTPLSRPRVLSIQKRDLHVGAAGSLIAFNNEAQIQRLKEPTIVSTILTRDEALKANPDLPETEENLKKCGHSAEYEVDLTKMHDKKNPRISSLSEKAAELNVDMTVVEISYLRSGTEKKIDDDALIHDVTQSLREAGVQSLCVTHGLDKYNTQNYYAAPSGNQWMQAATAAGFELASAREKPGSIVESVPNERGNVARVKPVTSGESTFVSARSPQSDTDIAESTRTGATVDVLTKT